MFPALGVRDLKAKNEFEDPCMTILPTTRIKVLLRTRPPYAEGVVHVRKGKGTGGREFHPFYIVQIPHLTAVAIHIQCRGQSPVIVAAIL